MPTPEPAKRLTFFSPSPLHVATPFVESPAPLPNFLCVSPCARDKNEVGFCSPSVPASFYTERPGRSTAQHGSPHREGAVAYMKGLLRQAKGELLPVVCLPHASYNDVDACVSEMLENGTHNTTVILASVASLDFAEALSLGGLNFAKIREDATASVYMVNSVYVVFARGTHFRAVARSVKDVARLFCVVDGATDTQGDDLLGLLQELCTPFRGERGCGVSLRSFSSGESTATLRLLLHCAGPDDFSETFFWRSMRVTVTDETTLSLSIAYEGPASWVLHERAGRVVTASLGIPCEEWFGTFPVALLNAVVVSRAVSMLLKASLPVEMYEAVDSVLYILADEAFLEGTAMETFLALCAASRWRAVAVLDFSGAEHLPHALHTDPRNLPSSVHIFKTSRIASPTATAEEVANATRQVLM